MTADIQCRVVLSHDDFIVRNHQVHAVSVLPGVTFLDIVYRMLAAAGIDHARAVIRNVVFAEPVATTPGYDREIRVTIGEPVDGVRQVRGDSRWVRDGRPESPWRENVTAELVLSADPEPLRIDLAALRSGASTTGDMAELYARARREDIQHGPPMRCTGPLYRGGPKTPYLLAELTLEQPLPGHDRFHLHPAILDASTLAGFGQTEVSGEHPFIPMFIREFRASRPLTGTCYVYAPRPEVLAPSGDVITSDYGLYDADGRFLAGFTGIACKRIRYPGLITRLLDDIRPRTTERLVAHLRAMVGQMLGRPAEAVAPDAGFYALGLDSVAILKLGRDLESLAGTQLYPTLLFEYDTIAKLAAYLADNFAVQLPEPDGSPVEDAAPTAPAVTRYVADCWVRQDGARSEPDGLVVIDAGAPVPADARDIVVRMPDDVVAACRALWTVAVTVGSRPTAGAVRITALRTTEDSAPDHVDPVAAALGALARTVAAEVPALRCRAVLATRTDLAVLAADDSTEAELRYVDGHRYVRRWTDASMVDGPLPLRQGGVYLITGGAGGIGRLLTDHLVRRWRARVLLVGRRPEPADLGERIRAWQAAGGEVRYVSADVADPSGARAAVEAARVAFGRIDGVVHAAGVRRDAVFLRKQAADFAEVFGPKALGTVHLDAALGDADLDFFLVVSSLSASLANPGQCDYAAANAYAEAFLRQRAARPDRRGRSIAVGWPLWADGGMRVPDEVRRRAEQETGLRPMPTADALAVFERALTSDRTHLVVLYGSADALDGLLPAAPGQTASTEAARRQPACGPRASAAREPVATAARSASAAEGSPPERPDAIAVIGVAGRYPMSADLETFWKNLVEGRDCITEVPPDRWDHAAIFDPSRRPGRTYGKWGGFLDGVDRFDPLFFGISRREAERMDPQERLFLMTCRHALEDAGYPPESLRGATVGVFAGVMWNHYQLVTGAEDGVAPTAMHAAVANRVSYTFDFTGPSMAIDTSCSSSLTAVHLAVESLRRGECDLALAGGVNVTVHPQKYLQLAQGQWLSRDGRCRAFGRDGSGYVPGEGVGAVLLKPLARALADGDYIYGVIRATAVNHGGRTSGVTVPSPASQAALIERAIAQAGWDPATVSYVEAHGTGTSLGDPIEIDGASRVFSRGRSPHDRCAIGSVKSNIGHTEGAAGIAGLTKVLLQLVHRTIVPSLHAREPNPHIDFANSPFVVPQETQPWLAAPGAPRRAGVSAFGAGGANAHVLVEEAPPRPAPPPTPGPWLFVLSARDEAALRRYAGRMAASLRARRDAAGTDPGPVLQRLAELLGMPAEQIDPATPLSELSLEPTDVTALLAELGGDVVGLSPDAPVAELARRCGAGTEAWLADVAYTSQVGRTPMAERFAVVVRDADGLIAALERFAAAEEPGPDTYRGTAAESRDGRECVAWFRAGRLGDVAAAWVGGADVPWADCYDEPRPRRTPLPGYPFAEERCWLGHWRSSGRGPLVDSRTSVAADAQATDGALAGDTASGVSIPDGAVVDGRTNPAHDSLAEDAAATNGSAGDGPPLLVRRLDDGRIALLTMRAPMFTDELLSALREAFSDIDRDDRVRAVVVTGHGGIFSMGGTPAALAKLAAGEARFSDVPFLYEGLLRCDRPVISAMQGHAAGGGLAFGLYADIVVVAADADYKANFLQYGFTPGLGATYLLERRLGAALASEMMLTGRAVRGEELARRGADVLVVPASEVLARALDLARSVADKPALAVRTLKAELASRTLQRLPEVIERELEMHARVLGAEAGHLVQTRLVRTVASSSTNGVSAGRTAATSSSGSDAATNGSSATSSSRDGAARPRVTVTLRPLTSGSPSRPSPSDGPDTTDTTADVADASAKGSAATDSGPTPSNATDSAPTSGDSTTIDSASIPSRIPVTTVDRDAVRAAVEEVVGAVLYLERHEIDPGRTFAEMGLDSVGAVEVVGQLNQRFGTYLDSVAVYDHPTVTALTEAVAAALERSAALRAEAEGPAAQVPSAKAAAALSERPAVSLSVEPTSVEPTDARSALSDEPAPEGNPVSDAEPAGAPSCEAPASSPRAFDAPASRAPAPDGPAVVLSAGPESATFDAAEAREDDIAVIGMAGRFPDAPDLEAFWANLIAGRCSITEVPAHRWDVARHYDPDRRVPDRTYSKWAALLSDVDSFDARFFNLSPLDAEAMDPQQRLFLQEAWHALEDAGYANDTGTRRPWGVFVGSAHGDYADLLAAAGAQGTSQAFLGNTPSVLAARIAYHLNLTGPTMAIDTACSSSLVAVHLACTAIRRGDCDVALAGGVAVMATPKMHVWTSKTGMLSPTGRCAPFDASADGIVLGEGVGVVVLKRLSRALADGDHIHGVIRASGVNGDGRTNGITAPSASSQAELITAVQKAAGVRPEEIGYVEAHGTGTNLGDPIEVKALTAAFRATTDARGFCGLGSVKGNIGHTTLAAGVASLLKVLLALRHGELPPSVGFSTPNPKLELEHSPFFVVREPTPWRPGPSGRRVAAVSSFGFSGTNCHLVVTEPPRRPVPPTASGPVVIPLSARTPQALRELAQAFVDRVADDLPVQDVAYTLAVGRTHHPVRVAVVAQSIAELRARLRDLLSDVDWPSRPAGDVSVGPDPVAAVRAAGDEAARHAALQRLAAAYVNGHDPDWPALYRDQPCRRVPLPTYPFARTRYWIGGPATLTRDVDPADPLVADHRVSDVPVLPAAAMLRLFAEAGAGSAPASSLRLSAVRWTRPVTVTKPTRLNVTVRREGDGERVVTLDDGSGECARAVVTTGTGAAHETVDVSALPSRRDAADLYADFAAGGVTYRGEYRALEYVTFDSDRVIGVLRVPNGGPLHPAVLDGAMQAAVALMPAGATTPMLPFACERMDVLDPAATPRYAEVRRDGAHRFSVRVVDAAGRVSVRLTGVALRPAPVDSEPALPARDRDGAGQRDPSRLVYVPVWREAGDASPPPRPIRVAVLADPADPLAQALVMAHSTAQAALVPPDDPGALTTDPERPYDAVYVVPPADSAPEVLVRDAYRLVTTLDSSRPLALGFVLRGAVAVAADETPVPALAGLLGFARAVAAERPRWRVGCVDVGAGGGVDVAPVAAEPLSEPLVALRDGKRLVRRLAPAQDLPGVASGTGRGGHVVILGGAGGLGTVVARHLARTRAARITLIGRRERDERIDALLSDVARLGGDACYLRADAADAGAMRRAVADACARFGPVTGAVHAALVLRDRTLTTMTEADLAEVLAPKVAGSIAFAEALDGQPLEFLVFFSSALSFVPAPGQGNYAAASTFEDAYALALRRRGVPARVVNWGFWGSVGAVAAPEYRERFARLGIIPIEPDDGIAALERILAAGLPQAVVVDGRPDGLERLGIEAPAEAADLDRAVAAYAALDEYARALLARQLLDLSALPGVGEITTVDDLADRLHVHPRQRRLFDAVVGVLARSGAVRLDGGTLAVTGTVTDVADPTGRFPETVPHVRLLQRCVTALPEVLRGDRSGVEVLFPNGSPDAVEALYRGNPGTDYHHRLLADEIAAAARRISGEQRRPVRILEVGAGTGASTRFVLEACAGTAIELRYTDVSPGFLRHGEREFGGHPGISFQIFDMEREPAEQNLRPGTYDIVYATNVLHAGADVIAVLRNCAALLRPGGLLLVNEVTRASDFLTLTFGLTTGWWRFTDPQRRLPHAPLLTPAGWREAMADAGLDVQRILGAPGVDPTQLEQCVFVAVAGTPAAKTSSAAGGAEAGSGLARRARAYVRRVFAEVLKFDESELDDETTFDAYGVDSLVSLTIVDRFARDLGDLPATLLFEHMTIAALADHFAERCPDRLAAVLGGPRPAAGAMPESVAHPMPQPVLEPPAPAIGDASPSTQPVAQEAASGTRGTDHATAAPSKPAGQDAGPWVRPAEPGSGDIAVIGVAGRYPGSPDLDAFWQHLAAGRNLVTEVPAERWDWREHFDPRPGSAERSYSRWGAFLDGVDLFDPAFFGILPKDAAAMDPQERLFLEIAYQLLDDAGYLGRYTREPSTGVFAATMYGSYGRIAAAQGWPAGRYGDGHSAYWSIANRVSYVLDLRGPSFTVDSACSSSLTAVHLACESLRRGECRMAIAGGVNLILHPAHLVTLCAMNMLAHDGACKVFDERADGFVPGEGVGAVLLKPLADAVADGDTIWAVIKGGHVNAGGRTSGYTVPNPNAQAELVVEAIRRSGVDSRTISYIETHGTGTSLGDPIEIAALTAALRRVGGPDRCALGSVKANIGHLEGAAGIAGLTKVLLQLRHGHIAPCANLQRINPKIDLSGSPLYLPTELTEWRADGPRRAGVSSFGAGGANAHLIVEEYVEAPRPAPPAGEHLVLLSARTPEQLRAAARRLAGMLATRPDTSLAELAYSTQVGRAEHRERAAVLAGSLTELVERLQALADGRPAEGAVTGTARNDALLDDEDGAAYLDRLVAGRRLAKLGQLWTSGTQVDFRRLWPGTPPRRLPLPEYPYERRRYWLPDQPPTPASRPQPPASTPRPPASTPQPTDALPERFAGEHLVAGAEVVPGAALLAAIARAARQRLGDECTLTGLRWPATLGSGEPRLETGERDAGLLLRLVDADGRTVVEAVATAGVQPAQPVDLGAIRARCRQRHDPGDVYAALRAGGLKHGPSLRVLAAVHTGDGECLARLVTGSGEPAHLRPALVDGAFQALSCLATDGGRYIPVAAARVSSHHPLPDQCWAYGRELAAAGGRRRFDVRLVSDDGTVLASIEELAVAPLAEQNDSVRYLVPAWRPEPLPEHRVAPRLAAVVGAGPAADAVVERLEAAGARTVGLQPAGPDSVDLAELPDALVVVVPDNPSNLDDELACGLYPLLWGATAILARRPQDGLRAVVGFTHRGQVRPAPAALPAVLRTLALEHTRFAGACVAVDGDADELARHLVAEVLATSFDGRPEERAAEIRYVAGERQCRDLVAYDPPLAPLPLRDGGVYLVTGGAGALGRHVARYLATRARATVVLVGQSELDAGSLAELAALAGPGSVVRYRSVDVGQRDAVATLIREIRREHGPLTGVVHAAGVTRDARAVAKTPADVAAVLAPKVYGAVHLDDATAGEPLEFFVLFSSVAGRTGNLGQVDYAYANAFLAEFATWREQRRAALQRAGRTVAVGWPLWADGGMGVDDATRELFAKRWGSAPLATADGLRAFGRLLGADQPWVLVHSGPATASSATAAAADRSASPTTAHTPHVTPEELLPLVEAALRRVATGFLLVPEEHVDFAADLMDTGFDSISLTGLINQINDRYGLDLLPTVLFECVNLAAFARYLVEHHAAEVAAVEAPAATERPAAQAAAISGPASVEASPAVQASALREPTDVEPSPAAEPAAVVVPAVEQPAAVEAPAAGEPPGAVDASATSRQPAAVVADQPAVAVIGMAAVLPGSANLAEFWQHLRAGRDLTGPVPADRTDLRADPATKGIRAGFIADVRSFDAALFGISPREAVLMDPQQRLFLQTVWRAVEDAGYAPSSFAGSATGLFVGVSACDYDDLLRAHGVPVEAHTASGLAHCILANRVSHLLDLRGPSEAIDTACSSSLVAVHRAVRAIQTGECDAAFAGGVNLLLSPGLFVAFTQSGMLSPDGRCKTFDERADGYARGEGCGVVLLKRLDRAIADGDHVYGVILGTAVNHGGRATSLTAPNPRAQADVIVAAHRRAGIDPQTIGYIEAHGTGTKLGDPIEVEGLKQAFRDLGAQAAGRKPWIALGSVKANIGHLEAAAGIAGLLKVLLAARHGELPPSINVERLNPYLRLDDTPFYVIREPQPWPATPGSNGVLVRRAAVSSFGFGGTNAHVVVEVPAEPTGPANVESVAGPHAIVISAPSAEALDAYAAQLADHLAALPDEEFANVAYTLQVGRQELRHRLGYLAADRAEAVRLLRAGGPGVHRGTAGRAAEIDPDQPLSDLVAAWVRGAAVRWADRWPAGTRRVTGLPSFPFARTEFWFDEGRAAPNTPQETPMTRTASASPAPAAPEAPPAAAARRPKVTLAPARAATTAVKKPAPVAVQAPTPDPPVVSAPSAAQAVVDGACAAPTGIADTIRQRLAAVLGTGTAELADDASFADLGLDSIFRMELVRHLNDAFGVELKAADLYEHDTIAGLAAFVAAARGAVGEAAREPLPAPAPKPAARPTESSAPSARPAESPVPAVRSATSASVAQPAESPAPVARPAHLAAPTAGPTDSPALVQQLRELLASVLNRPVDPDRTFSENGFTSFDMLRAISALERRLGPQRKTLLFDRPTLADLARDLVDRYGPGVAERLAVQALDNAEGARAAGHNAQAAAGTTSGGTSSAGAATVLLHKRRLHEQPDLADTVADLERRYGKEGGLAGRDIAPMILLGAQRGGYFHVSIRDGILFAWSYVGTAEYFPVLAGELMRYARAHGLRPNFLSMLHLDAVDGEPITATPFGAVQRLEDLSTFTLSGGRMARLRYMVRHFERAGAVRTVEYRSGTDPATDRAVADMIDRWTQNKRMVNPYVSVVRNEIRSGALDDRYRLFLTYLNGELANAIVITKIPSEPGYLLDLEFYPPDAPLGGLEYAIVRIIEQLRGEGCTMFSFGASFGVAVCKSPNPAPEVVSALEELRSVGIFGSGNFQFKNKFRPTNLPIYLCQPAGEDRTPVADIILMIANPDLVDRPEVGAGDTGGNATAGNVTVGNATAEGEGAGRTGYGDARRSAAGHGGNGYSQTTYSEVLARHGYNPLAVPHAAVPYDLATDSWAERDDEVISRRLVRLGARSSTIDGEVSWLPFPYTFLVGSGRSAEALLCRVWPSRRGIVVHNGVFPTWYRNLGEAGFTPLACSGTRGDLDLEELGKRLASEDGVAFVCVELTANAAGGLPVSLDNLREVRRLASAHGVPLVVDAARVVENAVAVAGDTAPDEQVWRAVRDILALADTVVLSLTKDFGVAAGGLLATRDGTLAAAARDHIGRHGHDLPLLGRRLAAAALRDTAGVLDLVRQRMAAVRALWQVLHDAGVPLAGPAGGHAVLLDTSRLPRIAGYREPVMSLLAWMYAETGVRGAPHLGEPAGAVRLAVPVGMSPGTATEVGRRLASLLSGPAVPPDLVSAGDAASPAIAAYHPADQVPDDVAEALAEGHRPADDNAAVLAEHCPAVVRTLVPVPHGEVEVFHAGEGPTLLLLPPFNIGAGVFARQFAGLSDRYRVVSVHHPGVGATTDLPDITLDGLADVARLALEGLGVEWPVHVAGASFGGLAALSFALRYPDRAASLILLGSSYKIGNRVGEINRLAVVAREDFDAVVAGSGSARLKASRADLERLLLRCESMDPRIGLRYLDVFAARPSLLPRLGEIAVPTLVIQGRHDTVIPLKVAHLLHGAIPDCRYVELANSGHFPGLTEPDEVNRLIAEFTCTKGGTR